MLRASDLVVLPIDSPLPIVHPRSGGAYDVVGSLPCARGARARDIEGGWVVVADGGRRVQVFAWTGKRIKLKKSLEVPKGFRVLDAVVVGPMLYAGGEDRLNAKARRLALTCRLDVFAARWESLDVGADFEPRGPRKRSVDAILVDGDRLILVDDIAVPKWFFVYSIADPKEPKPLDIHEISDRANETIERASLGPRHLAVLSGACHMGGWSRIVELFERRTLASVGYVSRTHDFSDEHFEHVDIGGKRDQRRPKWLWYEITFCDHWLLIAGGRDGLGLLDTRDLHGERDHDDQLHFRPPPPGAEVVDVLAVPSLGGCYAIVRSPAGRAAEWHAL